MMRASRLALSTNALTHTLKVHTGIYTYSMDIVTHYITSRSLFIFLSHHPQPQPQFSLFVLPSLYFKLCPVPVLRHAIPITSFTLPLQQIPKSHTKKKRQYSLYNKLYSCYNKLYSCLERRYTIWRMLTKRSEFM